VTNTPTQTAANQLISQYRPSPSYRCAPSLSHITWTTDAWVAYTSAFLRPVALHSLLCCCRLFRLAYSPLLLSSLSLSYKPIITLRLSYRPVITLWVSADFVLLELLPVLSRDLCTHLFLNAYCSLFRPSSVVWLVCFGAAGQAPSYISMSDWTDGDPAQCQSFLGPVERSRPKRRNSFAQKPHPSPPKTITTSLTACVLPCNLLWHGHTDNESQKEPTLSTKIRQKIGILRTKVQGFKVNV